MRKMTKEQREHIEWLMSLTPELTIEHYIGEEPAYVSGEHESGGYIWRYNDYVSNTFCNVWNGNLLNGETNFSYFGTDYNIMIVSEALWIINQAEKGYVIRLIPNEDCAIENYGGIKKLTIPKLDRIINAIPYESKIDRLFKDKAKELWEKYKAEGKMDWCEDRDI